MTRVRQVPGVRELTRRSKINDTDSGRPMSRWSRMSCSKKRSAGRRPVEHPGVGDLELAKRQLVDVTGAHIGPGQRRGQTRLPAPEEAFHRARSEPVADRLQRRGVLAVTEAVVQGGVADAEPVALP